MGAQQQVCVIVIERGRPVQAYRLDDDAAAQRVGEALARGAQVRRRGADGVGLVDATEDFTGLERSWDQDADWVELIRGARAVTEDLRAQRR